VTTLFKLPEKSVIVMDNAAFHKGVQMKQALKEAGHTLLYLPPYSPDLNPIEHKWAKLKKSDKPINVTSKSYFNAKNYN
jgi:transposase